MADISSDNDRPVEDDEPKNQHQQQQQHPQVEHEHRRKITFIATIVVTSIVIMVSTSSAVPTLSSTVVSKPKRIRRINKNDTSRTSEIITDEKLQTKVLLADCSKPYSTDCCLHHHSPSSSSRCPHIVPSRNTSENGYLTYTLTETFEYLQAGGSISRFGDGELQAFWKDRSRATWEKRTPELQAGLKFVASLGGSLENYCLCVGTYPVLDRNFAYFRKGRRRRYAEQVYPKYMDTWKQLMPTGQYCDSFVSRPDGVPKEKFPAFGYYTPQWQRVFTNQTVLLVRGGKGPIFDDNNDSSMNKKIIGSLVSTFDKDVFDRHLKYAKKVEQVLFFNSSLAKNLTMSLVHSYTDIFPHYVGLRDAVLQRLETGDFDVVVLSLGQAATVMAAELACRGYRALDVGQFGGNVIKRDRRRRRRWMRQRRRRLGIMTLHHWNNTELHRKNNTVEPNNNNNNIL